MSSNGEGTQDETTDNNKKKLLFGGKYQMKTKTDEIRESKTTSVSEINCDDINKLYISKNVECIQYLQSRAALPFPGASRRFYAGQYVKTTKKHQKRKSSHENPSIMQCQWKRHYWHAEKQSGGNSGPKQRKY